MHLGRYYPSRRPEQRLHSKNTISLSYAYCIRNSVPKQCKPMSFRIFGMEFLKCIDFLMFFQWFWNLEIENIDISEDVYKKWNGTPMELLTNSDFQMVVQWFWNRDIRNLNISVEVCKKWSATPMELLKNSDFPDGCSMVLKSWYQKS